MFNRFKIVTFRFYKIESGIPDFILECYFNFAGIVFAFQIIVF